MVSEVIRATEERDRDYDTDDETVIETLEVRLTREVDLRPGSPYVEKGSMQSGPLGGQVQLEACERVRVPRNETSILEFCLLGDCLGRQAQMCGLSRGGGMGRGRFTLHERIHDMTLTQTLISYKHIDSLSSAHGPVAVGYANGSPFCTHNVFLAAT